MLPTRLPLLLALALPLVAGPARAHEGHDDDERRGARPTATAPDAPAAPSPAAPSPAAEPPAWDVQAAHGPGADATFTVSEGTWMSVDLSPDGTTLLFDLLGDLYTLPVAGGAARALTQGVAWDTDARWSPDGKRILFASDRGGNEEIWVMDADGSSPARLTREDTDRYTDPVWAPEAGWFLARRRSVDTRSIGVQELWLLHEKGGKGVQLTHLEEDPHAGEAAFSPDGRYIYFSTRSGRFEYNHNPNGGLWQIARYDRVLGERVTLTDLPSSAARPTPAPDGRTLAFLTRDRATPRLALLDLVSGRVRMLPATLDPDQMEGFELRHTYPRMDWSADGSALYYWAGGGLWRLDVASGASARIPFTAEVKTHITEAVHPAKRLDDGPVHAKVVRWAALTPDDGVIAAALGRIWKVGATTAPLTPDGVTAYFPSLSADRAQLAWVSWSDQALGQVWMQPLAGKGKARQLTVTGADYQAPALSPDGRQVAFLRGSGAPARGQDLGSEASYDLVVAPISDGKKALPASDGRRLRSVPFRGSNTPAPRLQWSPDATRISWIEEEPPAGRTPAKTVLVSCDAATGLDRRVHVRFEDGAEEARLSPDGRWIVFRRGFQAYLAAMPALGTATMSDGDLPTRKLTDLAGQWVDWAGPGTVSWSHGDVVSTLAVDGLLDREAKDVPTPQRRTLSIEVPQAVGQGVVAFTHAHLVPVDAAPIADGTLVVDGRRIVAIGKDVAVPAGAKVIDVGGRTILPGIVDVHAHLHYASGDVFPEQEWRHLVNLAYGVTTVFDPSASSDLVFGQGELVAAGRMAGPRVLSTGYILYGALSTLGARLEKPEDAEREVQRLKDQGAWGIKSYQQSHRSHRQWLVEASRKLGVLDVPEGGGDTFQNLGMILDGHSSIEHAIPNAPLYDDVVQLWSRSRTTYVPTLLVAYGGLFGEVEQYMDEPAWKDARLARFTPPDVLIGRSYRLPLWITDRAEFHHHAVAQAAAKLRAAGVDVALGAHGQLQGLGPHWEMEMLGGEGAMTPAQAIEAATLTGARHLGLDRDIGSLTPGKVADLYIVDGDPLTDLKAAREVVWVMKDGLLYDAATMNRVAPSPVERRPLLWEAARR